VEATSLLTLVLWTTIVKLPTPDCLCGFSDHQTLKFDLYFLHSVRPPLVIQDFTFAVVFLREIQAVLKPDLIQFGAKTGYSARNIGIVHETILSVGPVI